MNHYTPAAETVLKSGPCWDKRHVLSSGTRDVYDLCRRDTTNLGLRFFSSGGVKLAKAFEVTIYFPRLLTNTII